MKIEISPMTESDLDEVMMIEEVSFLTPWSRSSYLSELQQNNLSLYLVARYNEEVVGYAGIWMILDEGHITNIAVHPNYRNRGIGYRLMREIIKASARFGIRGITLEVRPSNRPAQCLYRKLGFTVHGLRKGYYSDSGEDAIVMWKYIPQPQQIFKERV